MSQTQTVLKHLKEKGTLTSFQAFSYYHITRLSARILELRESGVNIKTEMIESDKPGNAGNFAKYRYVPTDETN